MAAMNLSLYIHIPFCVKKCFYCDFASVSDSPGTHEEYISSVLREMEFCSHEMPESLVAQTLYMGGGTPSLLHPKLVGKLIEAALKNYNLAATAEITLEANPGTVTAESFAGYRSAGVNRLSIGIQSLDDSMLSLLGRAHSAQQARNALSMARSAGFDNIGIDLIHSLPGQTLEHWQRTLHDAVALGADHISAYGLTVEEGTPFSGMLDRNEISLPGNDDSAAMYEAAMTMLEASGYEHYEIANFARPGFRSRHNQVYWQRGNYLGFGAAAHSFLREPGFGQRWSNPSGIADYCSLFSLPQPLPKLSHELLAQTDAMSEAIFLGLRLLEGIAPERFREAFGMSIENAFPGVVERQIARGLLQYNDGRISLSRKGVLLANQVFTDFV